MAEWKTYLGFFQSGEVGDTCFDNFYPVMEKMDGFFVQQFPHPDFCYGSLQLKRKHSLYDTQQNIFIEEISKSLTYNALTVVSINIDKLTREDQNGRYLAILLDSSDPIERGIRVEQAYNFEDIFGKDYKVLIPVKELELATKYGNYNKKACAFPKIYMDFPKIPCLLQDDDVLAIAEFIKIASGTGRAFRSVSIESVTKLVLSESIAYGNAIPYCVDANSWSYGKFDSVYEIELVELRSNAEPFKGSLQYSQKTRSYGLIPAKGVKPEPKNQVPTTQESVKPKIDFVEQTTNFLRASGRDVSKADVINYCICITQGFITTFAGAPGTGKTTLCRLLAKAMGLSEEDGQYSSAARYAEISVERGWTSIKDFIGYPNPFPTDPNGANSIVASNVDACNAFRRMNEFWEKEQKENPLYLMLLDEANLSPIEYYWSQFLKNCQLDDPEELPKRKINVAQTESWKISPNLRFLATVNFDHTTEELSPRFLDRSWVITLNSPDNMLPKLKPDTPQPVSMETLDKLFGYPKEGETFPEAVSHIWNDIRQAFKDKNVNLPLSPRNILAVENYCIAASRFSDTEITPEQALDFAVLQKILTTISGYGSRCENLVNLLLDISRDHLPNTYKKLEQMRETAEANSQFYQFFAR